MQPLSQSFVESGGAFAALLVVNATAADTNACGAGGAF
jgi:hypothetical protein